MFSLCLFSLTCLIGNAYWHFLSFCSLYRQVFGSTQEDKKTLDKLTFILYSITIMTKTHFETIANNLNIALRNDPNAHNAITFLARNLADEFEAINPRFNRSKFLAVALA